MTGIIERADQFATAPATVAVGTSPTTLLAKNLNRKKVIIQNLSTVPVFLHLTAGASTSVFTIILKAGTAVNDGTGGTWISENLAHTDIITAAVTTGTANVQVTEY